MSSGGDHLVDSSMLGLGNLDCHIDMPSIHGLEFHASDGFGLTSRDLVVLGNFVNDQGMRLILDFPIDLVCIVGTDS